MHSPSKKMSKKQVRIKDEAKNDGDQSKSDSEEEASQKDG
jgi:hypothetical protein